MVERETIKEAPAQVFLQPIAPPSILGLFGFAVAAMIVSTHMLGWYGNPNSPLALFPFVALFGGLAQFLAGLWAFRARDGLAVAVHGLWGSFWMAYGLLYWMAAAKMITLPASGLFPEMGIWFVGLAWVTWIAFWAARSVNFGLMTFLLFLAAGSTAAAVANFSGSNIALRVGFWLLLVSAITAWYTASGLLLESVLGRSFLPLGKAEHAEHAPKVAIGVGEPGVTHGQL